MKLPLSFKFGILFILPIVGFACNNALILPFTITEIREPCSNYQPLKQPFFGNTHVHTSYSFDAYTLSVRNDPCQAYEFAKGMPVSLPEATAQGGVPQNKSAQIKRPLNFLAVTDRAEQSVHK